MEINLYLSNNIVYSRKLWLIPNNGAFNSFPSPRMKRIERIRWSILKIDKGLNAAPITFEVCVELTYLNFFTAIEFQTSF